MDKDFINFYHRKIDSIFRCLGKKTFYFEMLFACLLRYPESKRIVVDCT